MNKAALRSLVLEALRRTPQTHVHAIENEVRQRANEYERSDALLVQEVVWDLLTQGILAPGKNSLNLHLPFVHVTEYGQRCLEEGAVLAHDPEGYAARLRAETQDRISPVVLEGTQEALLAFHRGLFRASLVLLSRTALAVLVEVQEAMDGEAAGLSELADSVRRAAAGLDLAPDLRDGLDAKFSELAALARLAHTEARAPRPVVADRETVLGRLLLFPAQCASAYALLAACRKRKATTKE